MKKALLSLALLAGASSLAFADITETLTADLFNIATATTYQNATYTSTTTGVTYQGNMSKTSAGAFQIRTTGNNSGIVITGNEKDLVIKSISFTFASGNTANRKVDVYGNTALYPATSGTDAASAASVALYNTSTQGTLIGSETCPSQTSTNSFTAEDIESKDYVAFGLRSNSGAAYISQIVITYADSGEPEEPETPTLTPVTLSFPDKSYTADMSTGFEDAPKVQGAPEGVTVTYSSSETNVATVDATSGAVTLVGRGTTTITATSAATDTYAAGEASYTLTVTSDSGSEPGNNTTTVTFDFVNEDYGLERKSGNAGDGYLTDGQQVTSEGVTLTFNGDGNGWRLWTDGLREYYKNSPAFTVSANGKSIIEISLSVNSGVSFKVDGYQDGANITTWTGDATSVTFTGTSSSNAAVKTIAVTFATNDDADVKIPVVLEFEDEGYTVAEGAVFDSPKVQGAPDGVTVTYTSSNEEVATVDSNSGEVTIVGVGDTTITATSEETDTYASGSASYTLTVTPDSGSEPGDNTTTVTFDFVNEDYGLERKSGNAGDGYLTDGQQVTSEGVTLTFNGSGNAWRLWTDGIREYSSNAPTFTVSANSKNITSVELSVVSGATFKVDGYQNGANITSWSGNALEVTFIGTATANKAVQTVTVTYEAGTATAIESINAEGANAPVEYFNLQGVKVTNPQGGVFIQRQGDSVSKVIR